MKRYTIFRGPNGAGKSTLYQAGIRTGAFLGERINVDEFAATLGDWRDELIQRQAARAAVERTRHCIRRGLTFHQESTLAGRSIFRAVQSAKESGYVTELHYVCVENPSIAVARVHDRVRRGGHGVADAVVMRRYVSSLDNLREYLHLFDYAVLYDNSTRFETVAQFRQGVPLWVQEGVSWVNDLMLKT